MTLGLRFGKIASLVFAAAIVVACSNSDETPPNGNNGGDGGVDSGGDTNPDGGGGGPDLTTCAGYAKFACEQVKKCTGDAAFVRSYEDMDRCVAFLTAACDLSEDRPADPAKCIAESTCEVQLSGVVPAACYPKRGTKTGEDAKCGYDSECVAGQYCLEPGSPGEPGKCHEGGCYVYQAKEESCDEDRECAGSDQYPGVRCTKKYDKDGDGHVTSEHAKCRDVTLGTKDAECAITSEKRCAAGFVCNAEFKCKPFLGEGADCGRPTDAPCDVRFGLACQRRSDGSAGSTCRPSGYAPIGAECGDVQDPGSPVVVKRDCATAVAYCDMSSSKPYTCKARVEKGAPCTVTTNNCLGLYVCREGTCQDPEAPSCPTN